MNGRSIDMRMSWCEAAKILIAVLMDGEPKGRREATTELMKMAQAADLAVEQEKLVKALQEQVKVLELRNRIAVSIVERFVQCDHATEDRYRAPPLLIADAVELVKAARAASKAVRS